MSEVDEFHYCVGITTSGFGAALPFSVKDCPHCTEADYPLPMHMQLPELRTRLESLHERIKGQMRDYKNGRTKDRYHERARGVRLAIDELDRIQEGR